MIDCFVSYTMQDAPLAGFLQQQLESAGVRTFIAPIRIRPGARWSEEIRTRLDESSVVFFLASQAACRSPSVMMEIGAAWAKGKTIIPIIWDMAPEELPGWMKERQAIDLRGRTAMDLLPVIGQLSRHVARQRLINLLLFVGMGVMIVASLKSK